jgi:Tfp pilus assembly protein PilO
MFSFLSGLNPKVYFIAFAVFAVVLVGGYIGYLEYKLKNKEIELIKKEQKIKETNDDLVEQNKSMI